MEVTRQSLDNITDVLEAVRNDLLDLERWSVDEDEDEIIKSDITRLNDVIKYLKIQTFGNID